jgi:hypothetical protein
MLLHMFSEFVNKKCYAIIYSLQDTELLLNNLFYFPIVAHVMLNAMLDPSHQIQNQGLCSVSINIRFFF